MPPPAQSTFPHFDWMPAVLLRNIAQSLERGSAILSRGGPTPRSVADRWIP